MYPTTPEAVRDCVIAALRDILGEDGTEIELTDNIKPIGKLGLKSIDGLDFACELSAVLGFDLPNKDNPLVDDARNRARTIGEIVKYACDKMGIKYTAIHAA